MRLFISREALDEHLKIGGPIMYKQLAPNDRARAALEATALYQEWYPYQCLPFG